MKTRTLTLLAALTLMLGVAAAATPAFAQNGPGPGTCPNPLMQDVDGDGIPNGQDADYVRPQDGTGNKFRRGNSAPGTIQGASQFQWRHTFSFERMRTFVSTFGFGPGTGTGDCDGTGPKGFGGFGRR